MVAVPASAALTVALTNLLYLDGRTMPDSPDRDALFEYVGASRWLRFGLGVGPDEKMPQDDDGGLAAAATPSSSSCGMGASGRTPSPKRSQRDAPTYSKSASRSGESGIVLPSR